MPIEITSTAHSATNLLSSHQIRTKKNIEDCNAAGQHYITAKTARKDAVEQLKKANRILGFHRIRLWAARHGMENWLLGLISGSFTAFLLAMAFMTVPGMGLSLVLFGVLLGYLVFGGIVFWLFRDSTGEYAGNRVQVRTEQMRRSEEGCHAAAGIVKAKMALEANALLFWRSLQEVLRSEAYKNELERDRLLSIDPNRLYPDEFEQHVAAIFIYLGFTVEMVGQRGDQGVDVIAVQGARRIAIQAKRYIGSVGNAAVQEVYAGMTYHRCHRCIVITSGEFTSSAIALARSTGCLLIGAGNINPLIRGTLLV